MEDEIPCFLCIDPAGTKPKASYTGTAERLEFTVASIAARSAQLLQRSLPQAPGDALSLM